MSLNHCKAQYTLTCGTAPHIKKQLVKQLQKWPFSINYDGVSREKPRSYS